MSRCLHFGVPATRQAHRALGVLVRAWGGLDQTANSIAIEALHAWLGQCPAGQGLTSEPDSDYAARVTLGVRVTTDQHGALVVRVPRKQR